MKKVAKKPRFWTSKKIALTVTVVAVIVSGVGFVTVKVRDYNAVANQANIVEIRELVLLAVRGLHKDAPVDPRTGDVYFPEARLYLPNPHIPLTLTYLYDTGNVADSQSQLSVSTYPVRSTQLLYQARDTNELFAAVPKLQACARGIKLVDAQFPASDTQNVLRHTVTLTTGKTIYVYVEKSCPELNDTADMFTNLKSY